MSTTVILAAGLFPTTARALAFLHNADYIACCDGAANACVDAGFEPDVIVGDGDSVREDVRERYAVALCASQSRRPMILPRPSTTC